MKEHPDYKYRPRRKPKTLVKSPTPNTTTQSSAKESPPQTQNKYPFGSQFELNFGLAQRPATFPLSPYPPIDPAFALDLQARLHAMYYQSWRTYNPFTPSETTSPSPPSIAYGCAKPPKSTSPSIATPMQTSPSASVI